CETISQSVRWRPAYAMPRARFASSALPSLTRCHCDLIAHPCSFEARSVAASPHIRRVREPGAAEPFEIASRQRFITAEEEFGSGICQRKARETSLKQCIDGTPRFFGTIHLTEQGREDKKGPAISIWDTGGLSGEARGGVQLVEGHMPQRPDRMERR